MDRSPHISTGVSVDLGRAAEWTRGSLAQGSALAALITSRLARLRSAVVFGPNADVDLVRDWAHGREVPTALADVAIENALRRSDSRSLVVEDDLGRHGDPNVNDVAAFAGDRPIRWTDVSCTSPDVRLLREGASGYPLNAYLLNRASAELGLQPGVALDETHLDAILGATVAVIVSVFDAEAFLLVEV